MIRVLGWGALAAAVGGCLGWATARSVAQVPPVADPALAPVSWHHLQSLVVGPAHAPEAPLAVGATQAPPPPAAGRIQVWTMQVPLTGTGSWSTVTVTYAREGVDWVLQAPAGQPVRWSSAATGAPVAGPDGDRLLASALRELSAWMDPASPPWPSVAVPAGTLLVPPARIADGVYLADIDRGRDERRVLPGPVWTVLRLIPDRDRVHQFALRVSPLETP
jgi:hypothetical protein